MTRAGHFFLALLALLAVKRRPRGHAALRGGWIVELVAAIILLVSREVRREQPLARLFAGVDFFPGRDPVRDDADG